MGAEVGEESKWQEKEEEIEGDRENQGAGEWDRENGRQGEGHENEGERADRMGGL